MSLPSVFHCEFCLCLSVAAWRSAASMLLCVCGSADFLLYVLLFDHHQLSSVWVSWFRCCGDSRRRRFSLTVRELSSFKDIVVFSGPVRANAFLPVFGQICLLAGLLSLLLLHSPTICLHSCSPRIPRVSETLEDIHCCTAFHLLEQLFECHCQLYLLCLCSASGSISSLF